MATIWLNVIRADGLRAADKNGFSDPYAICQVVVSESGQPLTKPKCKLKTKTCKKTLSPEWNYEDVWTGIIAPLETLSLRLEVFDKDTFSSEGLGKVDVPLSGLPEDEWKDSWFNLESAGKEDSRIEIKIKVRPAVTAAPPQANKTSDQPAVEKQTEAATAEVAGTGSSATAPAPASAVEAPSDAAPTLVGPGEAKEESTVVVPEGSATPAAEPPPMLLRQETSGTKPDEVPVVTVTEAPSPAPLAAAEATVEAGPSPGQVPIAGQAGHADDDHEACCFA